MRVLQGEVIHTGEQEVRGECCVGWSDEGAAGRSDTGEQEVRRECCVVWSDESDAGRSDTYR